MKRDRGGIESFMDNNRAWIPVMIFSGVMSAVMFASMISFIRMTMNPVEAAAVTEDAAANSDTQDVADTQSAAEDNGFASSGGGAMSTKVLSSFDSSDSGDFGCDFEF